MGTKLLRYKTIPPDLRDTSKWAPADNSSFTDEERKRFERFSVAVIFYLGGGRLKDAASAAGVSTTTFLEQLNRCLIAMPDGSVLGWAGLIYNLRVNVYSRNAPLPDDGSSSEAGYAGAFGKFLREHPAIKKEIDKAIKRGLGTKHIRTGTNTAESIFRLFLRLCKGEKIPITSYPLNTKSRGRRALERYIKKKLLNQPALTVWFGPDAAASSSVGNGKSSFDLGSMSFDMCGIDAHCFDVIGVIRVPGPKGPQNILVRRIWIYVLVDFGSGTCVGYAVSIRGEPTSLMIEKAVGMAQTPWKPRELKLHDVSYDPGAGFPVGTIEGLEAYRPCAIRLDNGMPGFATRVLDKIRKKLGCAISFGAIGAWWQNAITESLFRQLEQRGFHRVSSSMGTGPGDPRRDDPSGHALEHNIEVEELFDLADVAIANHNGARTASAGHRSRLDVMRQQIDPDAPSVQPPMPFPDTVLYPRWGVAVETKKARGICRPGKKTNVYVQVDKETYTNDALRGRHDLIGTPLSVHIDEDDLRTVEAFLPNGVSLGVLEVVDKRWRQSKHSRELRKVINRQRDELPPNSSDWVAAYFEHLAKKAIEEVKARPNKISQAASQLAEGLRATGLPMPTVNPTGKPVLKLVAPPPRPLLPTTKRPSWAR